MGPNFPLRANETRKENGIEIYINKTDQATKYVRPVPFTTNQNKLSDGKKTLFLLPTPKQRL